jgi:hypothetical protein
MLRFALALAAAVFTTMAQAQTRISVSVQDGNIFVQRGGATKPVTHSGRDREPVLSPDGTFVVFARAAENNSGADMGCQNDSDLLMRVGVDGAREIVLLRSFASTRPERQLCGFMAKQFSSDGRLLYFLTPGWATSGALHVYDFKRQKERFVVDASGLLVLSTCKGEHKDRVAVMRHKYFVFGGSYDWYWLYDPKAKREIGPLGEIDDKDLAKQAELWCE